MSYTCQPTYSTSKVIKIPIEGYSCSISKDYKRWTIHHETVMHEIEVTKLQNPWDSLMNLVKKRKCAFLGQPNASYLLQENGGDKLKEDKNPGYVCNLSLKRRPRLKSSPNATHFKATGFGASKLAAKCDASLKLIQILVPELDNLSTDTHLPFYAPNQNNFSKKRKLDQSGKSSKVKKMFKK